MTHAERVFVALKDNMPLSEVKDLWNYLDENVNSGAELFDLLADYIKEVDPSFFPCIDDDDYDTDSMGVALEDFTVGDPKCGCEGAGCSECIDVEAADEAAYFEKRGLHHPDCVCNACSGIPRREQ